MGEHFSAFSFVDRITHLEPGTRVRGRFAIPASLTTFSPCLVAEAVGQLAAWVAMAQVEFQRRPVAALAGEARMPGEAVPGSAVDLEVELESVDAEAVVYRGWARMDGATVMELERCVGPMLPMEEFDSPAAMREHFEVLRGSGAAPGRFHGVPEPQIVIRDREPGRRIRAALHVPVTAPFFADHFPRRPVFPATLLLDAQMRLARELAGDRAPRAVAHLRLQRVADVKFRAFIAPGAVVEMEMNIASETRDLLAMKLVATVDGKLVATARTEIVRSDTYSLAETAP